MLTLIQPAGRRATIVVSAPVRIRAFDTKRCKTQLFLWQPVIPVAAVYPPDRRVSRKVRTFIDFLPDRYGPRPEWDCRIAHLLPDG